MRNRIALLFLLAISPCVAGTKYIDKSATGANNGSSWQDAWTSLAAASPAPGDQVWIAGGMYPTPSGGWKPKGGTSSAPVTYQTAQEAGKNGMVIIDGTGQYTIKPDQGNFVLSGYVEGISGKPATPSGNKDELGGRMQFTNNAWDAKLFLSAVGANNNIKLRWIYVPTMTRMVRCENGTNITGLEVSYCWCHKIPAQSELDNQSSTLDDVIYCSGESAGGWFHHNYFEIPCSMEQLAYGDDGIKWPIDDLIEFNHFKIYIYNGWHSGDKNQHSDFIQGNPNSITIRNNWFENPVESVFAHYNRGGSGSFSKIYFYNNLITQSFTSSQTPVGRVIDFDPQPAGAWAFNDVLIANNTITNFKSTFPLMRFHAATAWNNCRIQNNAFYNCSNAISVDSSQIVQTANSTNPTSGDFVNAAGGDWHLSSNSSLKGKGTNAPKSVFTADYDGKTRVDPWDIGAFAYSGVPGPSPTPPGPSPTPPGPTPSPSVTPSPIPPKFHVGDVITVAPGLYVNVRSVPAGSTVLGTHREPDTGTILDGPTMADFGGNSVAWYDIAWNTPPDGWVGDDNLVISSVPQPTPTPPQPTPTPSVSPSPPVQTFEQWIQEQNSWIRTHPPYPDTTPTRKPSTSPSSKANVDHAD